MPRPTEWRRRIPHYSGSCPFRHLSLWKTTISPDPEFGYFNHGLLWQFDSIGRKRSHKEPLLRAIPVYILIGALCAKWKVPGTKDDERSASSLRESAIQRKVAIVTGIPCSLAELKAGEAPGACGVFQDRSLPKGTCDRRFGIKRAPLAQDLTASLLSMLQRGTATRNVVPSHSVLVTDRSA